MKKKTKGQQWLKKASGALKGTYGDPNKYIKKLRGKLGTRKLPWKNP